jgi:hypothetical protein
MGGMFGQRGWLLPFCFLFIVVRVFSMQPGSARNLIFSVMSNMAPATILISISHAASAKFIVAVFAALLMLHLVLPSFAASHLLLFCVVCLFANLPC